MGPLSFMNCNANWNVLDLDVFHDQSKENKQKYFSQKKNIFFKIKSNFIYNFQKSKF